MEGRMGDLTNPSPYRGLGALVELCRELAAQGVRVGKAGPGVSSSVP
jgi:hypothetical protein